MLSWMRALLLVTAVVGIATTGVARADFLAVTVGDSIVKTYPQPYAVPIQGWGATLRQFTSGVFWVNQAVGGTSTKSYVERGYWTIAIGMSPDFVLIQFGYADASLDPEGHTEPAQFRANLHQMILDVRAYGGVPILVTPAAVRNAAPDGIHVQRPNELEPWASAMLAQGVEDGVQVVDMHGWTLDLYDSLAMAQAQALYGFDISPGVPDRIHFSIYGATEAARMVASHLPMSPAPPPVSVFPYEPGNLELGHGTDSPIPPSSGQAILSVAGNPAWKQTTVNSFAAGAGWTSVVPMRLNAVLSIASAKLGWTAIVPLDLNGDVGTDLLSYDAATGQADYSAASTADCAGGLFCGQQLVGSANVGPGFTTIVPLNLNGDGRTDLLWYNTATGQTIYSIAATPGCAPGIYCGQTPVDIQASTPGWNLIVPLRLDGNVLTDLLFYR
jgi:lysophospholipase L1-like esterase